MSRSKLFKKPVHAVLLKPTTLEKLVAEGRVPQALQKRLPELPKEHKEQTENFLKFDRPSFKFNDVRKESMTRVKLKVLHDSVPAHENTPPCDSCVAVCCKAFIVVLTQMEYESGLYGDYAIKITPEMVEQLNTPLLLPLIANAIPYAEKDQYLLDGMIGQACPFLQSNNRCGIYENRPTVCRAYNCLDDPRITDDLRSGKKEIKSVMDLEDLGEDEIT